MLMATLEGEVICAHNSENGGSEILKTLITALTKNKDWFHPAPGKKCAGRADFTGGLFLSFFFYPFQIYHYIHSFESNKPSQSKVNMKHLPTETL